MQAKTSDSQKIDLLKYLAKYGSITQRKASESLGIDRLSARIYELRGLNLDISTVMIEVKGRHGQPKHIAKYVLNERVEQYDKRE